MATPSATPGAPTYTIVESPIGPLTLIASDTGLQQLRFRAYHPEQGVETSDHPILLQTATQLTEYFAGTRTTFDIPLDMTGTSFQCAVWTLLTEIPYGTTTSYGALAEQLGSINKSRAVGMANGRNPVAIIVPCHRVIGTSGALTGFGGGLDVKAYLLQLEQHGTPMPFLVQADLFG